LYGDQTVLEENFYSLDQKFSWHECWFEICLLLLTFLSYLYTQTVRYTDGDQVIACYLALWGLCGKFFFLLLVTAC